MENLVLQDGEMGALALHPLGKLARGLQDSAVVKNREALQKVVRSWYPFSHTLANSERAQLSDCYSFHSVVEA